MITKSYARLLRQMIVKASASLSDADALEAIELYDLWKVDEDYFLDDRRRDGNVLYKCVQPHHSQAGWEPHLTPALWTVVSLDEWPEWVQPTGVQDAYRIGDKVSHNDKHWISTADNNVWEPGVYGWDEA